jgi:hypothetical protein
MSDWVAVNVRGEAARCGLDCFFLIYVYLIIIYVYLFLTSLFQVEMPGNRLLFLFYKINKILFHN